MKNLLGLLALVFAFSTPTFAVDIAKLPPQEEKEGETEVEPSDRACGTNSGYVDVSDSDSSKGKDTEIEGEAEFDTKQEAIDAGEGTLAAHVIGNCAVCPPVANGDRCASFATTRGGAATFDAEVVETEDGDKWKPVVTVPDGATVLAGCEPC